MPLQLQEILGILAEQKDIVLYIYDLEERKYVLPIGGIAQMTGHTADDLKKYEENILQKLLVKEDYESYIKSILPQYKKLADEETLEHEKRIIMKEGSLLHCHFKEKVHRRNKYGHPKQILGVMININEARRGGEKIKNLIDHMDDFFFVLEHTNEKVQFPYTVSVANNSWDKIKNKIDLDNIFTQLLPFVNLVKKSDKSFELEDFKLNSMDGTGSFYYTISMWGYNGEVAVMGKREKNNTSYMAEMISNTSNQMNLILQGLK